MIDGQMVHQDSHGGGGVLGDGATQWMTAGRGILHIETPPESLVMSGGLFHGVQLWINLPAAKKWLAPAYQGLEGTDIALASSPDGGALVRVCARVGLCVCVYAWVAKVCVVRVGLCVCRALLPELSWLSN